MLITAQWLYSRWAPFLLTALNKEIVLLVMRKKDDWTLQAVYRLF